MLEMRNTTQIESVRGRTIPSESSLVSRWSRSAKNSSIGFVAALLLLHLSHFVVPRMADTVLFSQRSFVASSQGVGRCPNASSSDGPSSVVFARSRIECARHCLTSSFCLHYGYDSNNKTCTMLSSTPVNLAPADNCLFMMDVEPYGGCYYPASAPSDPMSCSFPFQYATKSYSQCATVNGSAVPQCVTNSGKLVDCLTPLGYSIQMYLNQTTGSPVPLPCISDWIVLMQRLTKATNMFYLNWTDYKNGFGDFSGSNFWIGNEKIYLITNVPGITYKLRVEVQTSDKGEWYYAEYSTFSLDSEALGYTLHVGSYSGNAYDSMSTGVSLAQWVHAGMMFTTPDVKNDMKSGGNCAVVNKGAWWFNDCYYSCLTCSVSAFSWYSLDDYGLQSGGLLRAARMMLKVV